MLRDGAARQEGAGPNSHDGAVEVFARVLLRRYGVVFRRLLERESLSVSWYELMSRLSPAGSAGRNSRGIFVAGIGGEQFALPEAVGRLRSLRKSPATGALVTISGADPLNLAGILTPGKRVAGIAANRILLRDGVPVAAQEGRELVSLEPEGKEVEGLLERTLPSGACRLRYAGITPDPNKSWPEARFPRFGSSAIHGANEPGLFELDFVALDGLGD